MGERRLSPRARLSARVQSLPPTPTTLSAHAPTLSDLKASVGKQRDVPGWNDQGRWIDSKAYKTIDAQNTASGQGDKHPVLMRAFVTAAPRVSFQDGDPSKAGSKYGPAGDKSSKYKSSRY